MVRYLSDSLQAIDKMPDTTFEQIVAKYVEMNVAHPFIEGNGRNTRIWLDLLLKKRLEKGFDWSKIPKKDYLNAMVASPTDSVPIFTLLKNALTDKVNNREMYLKGIDFSIIMRSQNRFFVESEVYLPLCWFSRNTCL